MHYVQKLTALRRQYGRQDEPFEIMLALLESPSVDLYRRAEDFGVTAVMCAPWAGGEDFPAGGHDAVTHPAERYRSSIERLAETIIDKCR